MNWHYAQDLVPTLNEEVIIKWKGNNYIGWRRAVDGKYELHGYYEDRIMPDDWTDFKWMFFPN